MTDPRRYAAWQMQITPSNLRARADILSQIRGFFAQRQVLEVDVPVLSQRGVTDPYLDNFVTRLTVDDKVTPLYLQTSPEYAMKRMLASGSGCIYSLAKAFRHESSGHQHNPEFTMLEWYRIGFDDWDLMREVASLLCHILPVNAVDYVSYHDVFVKYAGIDIDTVSGAELRACVPIDTHYDLTHSSDEHVLQLIFNVLIEPQIGLHQPCFIYDFPAKQAALAKIKQDNPDYAHRFEVYFKGIELANGYWELTDSIEQARRFAQDNLVRTEQGYAPVQADEALLAALSHGLPECAGVALGVDRLVMLALGLSDIAHALPFSTDNA